MFYLGNSAHSEKVQPLNRKPKVGRFRFLRALAVQLRAPRFRLILLMASTLGAVLWIPNAMRSKSGWLAQNYVTMAGMYGMLIVGEVIYWNVFGFERGAAQQWFATPIPFRTVLRSKNIVAVLFTLLVIVALSAISLALPVPIDARQIADALMTASVFAVFLIGGGNLMSVYMPRPVDGNKAWRNANSRAQLLTIFLYPLLGIPVAMAYLARWASGNMWSYYAVMAAVLIAALCFYSVATDTAVEAAERRKETIVAILSKSDGPISITS